MFNLRHKISKLVFPAYSRLLDKINNNAKALSWYSQHRSTPAFDTREEYFSFIASKLEGGPIEYLEFGVFKGESIREWASLNKHPESRFFGFDSFEGLPEKWNDDFAKGAFDVGGNIPAISDPRVSFVKGWFQNSLPPFLETFTPRATLVIHADADHYTSTLYLLTMLNRFIVPGTIVMFDEFASALHEFRAWTDYTSSYLRSGRPIAMTDDEAARVSFLIE